MEFEALARALSWCNKHTLVKVGRGLQVIPRLFLQLLTELLPLYRSNVCYTGGRKNCRTSKQEIKTVCVH